MFSMETYEEKIEALSEAFRIAVTREISKEVPNVCNLSAGVYNKGVSQGRQEGRLDTLLELVKDGILSITDAAKRADMKVSDFEKAYKTFLL